jgi:hypothetical protein
VTVRLLPLSAMAASQLRHFPREYVPFPLLLERPGHCAGAEIGHVLVFRQPIDGILENFRIFAKNRPVAGEKKLGIVVPDAGERLEILGYARAVMRIDDTNAIILVDVVAAEEEVRQLEAQLAGRVPWRMPDFELECSDLDLVPFIELHIDLARGHGDVEVLGGDCGISLDRIARFDRHGRP